MYKNIKISWWSGRNDPNYTEIESHCINCLWMYAKSMVSIWNGFKCLHKYRIHSIRFNPNGRHIYSNTYVHVCIYIYIYIYLYICTCIHNLLINLAIDSVTYIIYIYTYVILNTNHMIRNTRCRNHMYVFCGLRSISIAPGLTEHLNVNNGSNRS